MKHFFLSLLALVSAQAVSAQATVPADAIVEKWVCSFVMHYNGANGEETENVSEDMQLAFHGDEVYFNLPNPIAGNTWVKGTLSATAATFPSGQPLGSYSGSTVYALGQDEQGVCDLVMAYDAGRGRFELSGMQLVLSTSAASIEALAYYTGLVVSKSADVQQEDGTTAPPADAVVEEWKLTCRNVNPNDETQYEDVLETVRVAFSGSNIYIQGLCPANGWLKGTLGDGTATFPARQYLGRSGGYPFYAIGYKGEGAIDIVFSYDAQRGLLSTDTYILLITDTDQPLMELTAVVISREGAAPEEQPVEAPAGLVTQEYVLKATSVQYDTDGSIAAMVPVQWNVRVGFSGNEVYVQGLCRDMFPLAWVKGVLDDGQITFASGQFLGVHPQLPSVKYYFGSMYFQSLSDMVMSYSAGSMQGGGYYLILNSQKNALAPYEVYAGVSLTRVPIVPATPATPSVEGYEELYAEQGFARVFLSLPTTDVNGNAIDRARMSYRLYYQETGAEPQVYTFSAPLYENLSESMQDVPYFYSDGWDFYMGGTAVYLYESQPWERIGVQTVYTVPGRTSESPVAWRDISHQGIAPATAAAPAVVSEQCYDMQGRPAADGARGLLVRRQLLSDGTVRTLKVMR